MIDTPGKLHLTPEYQERVDAGEVDWWGVATDLAYITSSSMAGVVSAPWGFAAGALAVGLDALEDMNDKR